MTSNFFIGLINFTETLFNTATSIWAFLTSEFEILGLTISPLLIIGSSIGIFLVAWLIKKLIPIA